MAVPQYRAGLFCLLLWFGWLHPTALDGGISRPLTIAGLLGTIAILGAGFCSRSSFSDRPALLAAVGSLAVLAACTLTTPFSRLSPGVPVLYLALALIFASDLRSARWDAVVRPSFAALTVGSLTLGLLIVADVAVVDRWLVRWYAAFRPDLIESMVEDANKPVLTFATHSVAAFMWYLLFFLTLRTYLIGRRWPWLVALAFQLFLLARLESTTAFVLLTVALCQLAWSLVRPGRSRAWLAVGTGTLGVLAAAAIAVDPGGRDRITARLFGDRNHGLVARFAPDGLHAENLEFLVSQPTRPIGAGFSPNLYLGDSGILVTALRGSVPLLLAVYGGLWLWLRSALVSRRTALWLWLLIVAFESGFGILQYVRFLASLPFVAVYLNTIDAASAAPPAVWPAAPATAARHRVTGYWRWWAGGALIGATIGAALAAFSPRFEARAQLSIGPDSLSDASRTWYANAVTRLARSDDVLRPLLGLSGAGVSGRLAAPVNFRHLALTTERAGTDQAVIVRVTLPDATQAERLAAAVAEGARDAAAARWPTLALAGPDRAPAVPVPLRTPPMATALGAVAGLLCGLTGLVARSPA